MKNILQLLKNLLSLFYPRNCPSCQSVLKQHESHICLNCLIHLPETNYHLQDTNPLTDIFRGRVKIEHAASLLFYKKGNQVQHILHHLKYKGLQELGVFFGDYYGKKLSESVKYAEIDMIIPIPLHPKKLKMRGYNQSEALAQGLSQGMTKPHYANILVRESFTQTQTKKSRFNRWENVRDVFKVTDYEQIKGKKILLCDDVLTTGATIEAAAQELLNAEEVKIYVITLAAAH